MCLGKKIYSFGFFGNLLDVLGGKRLKKYVLKVRYV